MKAMKSPMNINSRNDQGEEKFCDLEDKLFENMQSEGKRMKRIKKEYRNYRIESRQKIFELH